MAGGGSFWLALNEEKKVVGSIGLQLIDSEVGVLKKFFLYEKYRGSGQGLSMELYKKLVDFARARKLSSLILDTPSVAKRSHSFYKKVGFSQISKDELPVAYNYPDRDSLLFKLDLK